MRRRMIAPEPAPPGIGAAIGLAAPAPAPPPCGTAAPGALTPTYRKPTPAIAAIAIEAPGPGSLVVVGRNAAGIRGLAAERIHASGPQTVHSTLKGAPAGPMDLEAWMLTGTSAASLVRVGACHTLVEAR
jgi:hypothetical protein